MIIICETGNQILLECGKLVNWFEAMKNCWPCIFLQLEDPDKHEVAIWIYIYICYGIDNMLERTLNYTTGRLGYRGKCSKKKDDFVIQKMSQRIQAKLTVIKPLCLLFFFKFDFAGICLLPWLFLKPRGIAT